MRMTGHDDPSRKPATLPVDRDAEGRFRAPEGARESRHRIRSGRYIVIRNCIPNARVTRITVAKVGLPSSDNAL